MTTNFHLCTALAVSLAAGLGAQVRTGSMTLGPGNRYAGANNTYTASGEVGTTTASSTVSAVLRASLLTYSRDVASRTFTARQDGNNRARVVFMGRVLRDEALPNGQVRSMPVTFAPAFQAHTGVDLGVVGIDLNASAGAGNQYSAVARNRTGSNPAAHLSGPSQGWVVGTGSATFRILWGAASVRVEVALEGLNGTMAMTLPTERAYVRTASMTCPVDHLDWRFYVRARARVLGIEVADRKLIDQRGGHTVRDILN